MSMLKVENLSVHYGMIQAVEMSALKSMRAKLFLSSVPMVPEKPRFFGPFQDWFVQVQEKLSF